MKKKKGIQKIPVITKYVLFPLLVIIGRKFPLYYRKLEKSQYYSLIDIQKIQLDKLIKLFKLSFNSVPFYNELYSSRGIKPDSIHSLDDLSKLPLIYKSDLKKNYPSKTINKEINPSKIVRNSTSGSTGKPFEFALNWDKRIR